MADVARALDADAPVNRDFSPILYYYHLRYWMSQFDVRFGLLEGVLLVILLVFLVRLRPVSLAVFSSGFAASALEVVLLMAFQILFGSLYYRVGLIVTMFMLGLGIGSFLMNRMLARRSRRDLVVLELAVALVAVCLPPVLVGVENVGHRRRVDCGLPRRDLLHDARGGRAGGARVSLGREARFSRCGGDRLPTLHGRLPGRGLGRPAGQHPADSPDWGDRGLCLGCGLECGGRCGPAGQSG